MPGARAALIWIALIVVCVGALVVAANSPLLAWRRPVYIVAGFAGVLALCFLLLQPMLIGGLLPGASGRQGRTLHRWIGLGLVGAVGVHVFGLWVTSPPDVVDALMLRSPTPFSIWGVLAMWAVFAAALLARLHLRGRIRPAIWRAGHIIAVSLAVFGGVVHALLIEGTMGPVSKAVLCLAAVSVTAKVLFDRKVWRVFRPHR